MSNKERAQFFQSEFAPVFMDACAEQNHELCQLLEAEFLRLYRAEHPDEYPDWGAQS